MPTVHYMDPVQIIKQVFDFDTNTIKTQLVSDQQLEISLDASEDSIRVPALTDTLSTNAEVKACDQMKKACLYVLSGTASIALSPVASGDVWVELTTVDGATPTLANYDITAMRIRLTSSGVAHVVLQG